MFAEARTFYDDLGGMFTAMLIGGVLAFIYFLPSIWACRNAKLPESRKQLVILINILLGWTIIGWLVCCSIAWWDFAPKQPPPKKPKPPQPGAPAHG